MYSSIVPPLLAGLTVLCLAAFSIWEAMQRRHERSVFLSKFPKDEKTHVIAAEAHVNEYPEMKRQRGVAQIQLGMKVVVTLALGSAALFIILSGRYGQDSLKWAYSILSFIAGYWLHT